MSGGLARRCRPLSGGLHPLLAVGLKAGVSLGLTVIVLGQVAPALGAPVNAASAAPPPPGGATPAAATSLKAGVRYSGSVPGRGASLWYQLRSDEAQWVRLELAGTQRACPFRVSVLDANRRSMGQLVSMLGETLPLIVLFPENPVSDVYYVRLDADPKSVCADPSYAFTLIEPEQTAPCTQSTSPSGEAQSGVCGAYRSAPGLIVPRACIAARLGLEKARSSAQSERALVDRRRGSVRELRRLEAEEQAERRRLHRACR